MRGRICNDEKYSRSISQSPYKKEEQERRNSAENANFSDRNLVSLPMSSPLLGIIPISGNNNATQNLVCFKTKDQLKAMPLHSQIITRNEVGSIIQRLTLKVFGLKINYCGFIRIFKLNFMLP